MSLPQIPYRSGDGARYDPVPLSTEPPSPGLHRPPLYDPYNDGSASNTSRGGTPDTLAHPHPQFLGHSGQRGSYAGSEYTYNSVTEVGSSSPNLHKDAFDPYRDDPRPESAIPMAAYDGAAYDSAGYEKQVPPRKSRKGLYAVLAVVAALLLIAAVAVPVVLTTRHKSTGAASSGSGSGSGSPGSDGGGGKGGDGGKNLAITGGDGSTVTTDDGSTFTYTNQFGGTWYFNEDDPFNNAAQPQSWSPALNQSFNWGSDIIRGCVFHLL